MKNNKKVILKQSRERAIKRFHPWIFSGAVEKIEGNPEDGDIVDIYTVGGEYLGTGFLDIKSQIRVRVLSYMKTEINEMFWKTRFQSAIERRLNMFGDDQTNAYRLIFSEGDNIPGLIIDKYNDTLVVQPLIVAVKKRMDQFMEIIKDIIPVKHVYVRDPFGSNYWYGEEGRYFLKIKENGVQFYVDIKEGQKTGFFLDQRDNRLLIKNLAKNKRVLDMFCYTGGFTVNALLGGCLSIESVDISGKALAMVEKNIGLNEIYDARYLGIEEDAFDYLRQAFYDGKKYDLIILDPPAFAKKKKDRENAAIGYKDINLMAMKLLDNHGFLFTCSCSHHISNEDFRQVLYYAAVDAERDVQLIGHYGHPCDHPVNIFHREGEYLKCYLLRML